MTKSRKKAVVLLSGGLDSSTTLALAGAEGYELYALSFNYRQRHAVELQSARMVAASFDVEKHLVVDFDLREIGGSALTSGIEVPKAADQMSPGPVAGSESHIPVTYVPARNTIFLSFALGWAEVLEAGDIFIGANAIDYSGYPDCRPEYLKAFEEMANLATKISVEGRLRFRVRAPLVTLKKSEIIRKGVELGLDYSLTWSCYDPQEDRGSSSVGGEGVHVTPRSFRPCGLCDSCRIRAKGFAEAGLRDPLMS